MTSRALIIAEAGVNHNGSLSLAKELVATAASCGADVVKFQSFKADRLVTAEARKADYQQAATGGPATQYEMLKSLELDGAAQRELAGACAKAGIRFMSTPFDEGSLDLLVHEIGVTELKIGSGDLTNGPLLLRAARSGLPIILSTGMATLAEVELALGVMAYGYLRPKQVPTGTRDCLDQLAAPESWSMLAERVTLLHCTTEYPAPIDSVNLRAMDTLRNAFGLAVGFSDHTRGVHIPVAAVALGATCIEKHFTLDRSLPGPDHKASLEPDELRRMTSEIRDVEAALGTGRKVPAPAEMANRSVARRSLVAARAISAGEVLDAASIAVKRPGGGIAPTAVWDQIGKIATRSYRADEALEP